MKDRGKPSEVIGSMGTSGYLIQGSSQSGRSVVSSSKSAASVAGKIIASVKKR